MFLGLRPFASNSLNIRLFSFTASSVASITMLQFSDGQLLGVKTLKRHTNKGTERNGLIMRSRETVSFACEMLRSACTFLPLATPSERSLRVLTMDRIRIKPNIASVTLQYDP